jgi:hypothetical protein
MHLPKCEICGQPAVIHETTLEAGAATPRHFCAEHGETSWRTAMPLSEAQLAGALAQAAEWFQGLPEQEKTQLAELYRLSRRGG